jgi:predicted nuclease of predicted toxin-antitoxin system
MILLDHCTPRQDASDAEVIALAQGLDAVLLTIDLDFANILNYPPEDYAGILVIRYQASEEAAIDTALRQALEDLYREGLRSDFTRKIPPSAFHSYPVKPSLRLQQRFTGG